MDNNNANEPPAVVTPTTGVTEIGDPTSRDPNALVVDPLPKTVKPRFGWGSKVMYEGRDIEKNVGVDKYPFLNDKNVKDYIFTKRLCIDTPFVGKKSHQTFK
jgi:hypothetical protein